MKCILLGLILVLCNVDANDDLFFTVDISNSQPKNASQAENRCFIDIKCMKKVNPMSPEDEYVFSDILLYANRTLSEINRRRGCQPLRDRDIFIAVNGVGMNLTSIAVPESWSRVHEVNMSHNSLTTIKVHSFGTSDIMVLDLSHNQIKLIDESAFENTQRRAVTIEMLLLQNNELSDLNDVRFSLEKRLKFLDISSNKFDNLMSIESIFFSHLSTLKADYNRITELAQHFRNMDRLEKLSLAGNSIKLIDSSALAYLSTLEVLDLSGNDIETLQPDMFIGLHSLVYVNMSHNKIDAITAEYFGNSPRLSVLDLSHNKLGMFALSESRMLAPLDYLLLNDNDLTENDIYEVLKIPIKVHKVHTGGNKFNCRQLIYKQSRRLVHQNEKKFPDERYDDIEIDCNSGYHVERFGVSPLQDTFRQNHERSVVPDFRQEENFDLLKKLISEAYSTLIEVKLTRKEEQVMEEYVSSSSGSSENGSHMSVATVACVSALFVLVALTASIGYAVMKYCPNRGIAWRSLRMR